jgi:hypothetical protein
MPTASTGGGSPGGMGGMGGMPTASTGGGSPGGAGGLNVAGMGTAGLPLHSPVESFVRPVIPVVRGWTTKGEEVLIPPGYLVPGQSYALPVRRTEPRRTEPRRTPLSLPLNTHPRNVKP